MEIIIDMGALFVLVGLGTLLFCAAIALIKETFLKRAYIMKEPKMEVKANLYSEDYVNELTEVLKSILSDATGDIENSGKRLWPIRAKNYRQATELLNENDN